MDNETSGVKLDDLLAELWTFSLTGQEVVRIQNMLYEAYGRGYTDGMDRE